MHNTPLFEQDLAAPYGSNLVFTTLFDQTKLTTPGAPSCTSWRAARATR